MNYSIIPISEDYIEAFWAAVDSVAREQKYLAFLEGPPIATTYEFVKGNIEGGWPHFLAVSDEKVIGWCDVTSLHRHVFEHAGVLGIGVIAGYRGIGIGEALIRKTIDAAKVKGLTRIELTVREKNKAAISLYEKVGFVKEGFHPKSVRIGTVYENHISMGLLL